MQHQLNQIDVNENRGVIKMRSQQDDENSDISDVIEASEKNVQPKRKWMKNKLQERSFMPLVKSTSSQKKDISPSQRYFRKRSSTQNISISPPLIENKLQKKYSYPLFSSSQSKVATESPLGQNIFNQEQHFESSLASTTLNSSFPSRFQAERFRSSKNNLISDIELNNEWVKLSQQLSSPKSPATSLQLELHVSQEGQYSYSPFSEASINESFVSSVNKKNLHKSSIYGLDLDIVPLQQYISHTNQQPHPYSPQVNEEFVSPVRDSSSDRSRHSSQIDDMDSNVEVNEVWGHVSEQMKVQNLHQNYLTQQNHNISKQIEQFEWYVRDKMEKSETYMKQKLSQFEESNGIIINALNDIKRLEREQPIRIGEGINRKNSRFLMPKIPISKAVSLVLLNNALKDTQYMEQFVSEVSHIVTLYGYIPRKSVRSIMSKLFTHNLLIKYSWSEASSGKGLPEFSSLTEVLRAISRLLTNYMSDRDIRREIKDFFKRLPQMKKLRYF